MGRKMLAAGVVLVALCGVHMVESYSYGAPMSACETMRPVHGRYRPLRSDPPFTVTTEGTMEPSKTITGNITSTVKSTHFSYIYNILLNSLVKPIN